MHPTRAVLEGVPHLAVSRVPIRTQGSGSSCAQPGENRELPQDEGQGPPEAGGRSCMGGIVSPQNSCMSQAGPGTSQRPTAGSHVDKGAGDLRLRSHANSNRRGRPWVPQVEGNSVARAPAVCQARVKHLALVSLVDSYEPHTIIAFLQTRKPRGKCNWAKTNLVEKKWPNIILPKNKLIAIIIC